MVPVGVDPRNFQAIHVEMRVPFIIARRAVDRAGVKEKFCGMI